jgi:hypothetical protein
MAGLASGTLQNHDLSFGEKATGRLLTASGVINGKAESGSFLVGRLSGQTLSADAVVGGPNAVIERGEGPGYVYYVGAVTPQPATKPHFCTPRVKIKLSSEGIMVSVPPSSGSTCNEFLCYLGDEGSGMDVEIDAAASSTGVAQIQKATSLRYYVRVVTDSAGKLYFANSTALPIPTSTSDPIKQYYDQVTGYAQSAGIDV